MRFLVPVFVLAALFCIKAPFAHAQIISAANFINENDLDFNIDPQYPAPHQQVTVSLQSFVIDLDKSFIAWSVDGKDIAKGYGIKMLQFTAKNIGQKTTIKVIVQGPDRPLEKTYVFEPSTLDLMWEVTDAYAPPFYKGKKLPGIQSIVKVAAIPDVRDTNGKEPAATDIVYDWKHELSAVQDQSGYGKDSVLIQKNRLRSSEDIDVDITTRDGASSMEKRITVPTFLPQVAIVPAPYSGFATDRNTFTITGSAVDLSAVPYFFTAARAALLPYQWTVGTTEVTDNTTDAIRIRQNDNASTATVSAAIQSPSNFFESASNTATLNFK